MSMAAAVREPVERAARVISVPAPSQMWRPLRLNR